MRTSLSAQPDVICFSHLRWDFVFQRPQHLMTRCARDRRVVYVEEPRLSDDGARIDMRHDDSGVWVVIPYVPHGLDAAATARVLNTLMRNLLSMIDSKEHIAWYYTPMALPGTCDLRPIATVFDCMDELSAFAFAPPGLREAESALLLRSDLVFTGGWSLYEAKRTRHPHVSLFPSSVDVAHFARARAPREEPEDQRSLPSPRLGYVGVIDERMDLGLLDGVAHARPSWQIVMVGPVVKIDPAALPRRPNIHYLGQRSYDQLPAYLAGWDVAIMPFAHNEATRFISPTKTPEYLAAGRPVVATSIRDVVTPYGELGLVHIADDPESFVRAVERAQAEPVAERLTRVDAYLAGRSWDHTWACMRAQIDELVCQRRTLRTPA